MSAILAVIMIVHAVVPCAADSRYVAWQSNLIGTETGQIQTKWTRIPSVPLESESECRRIARIALLDSVKKVREQARLEPTILGDGLSMRLVDPENPRINMVILFGCWPLGVTPQ